MLVGVLGLGVLGTTSGLIKSSNSSDLLYFVALVSSTVQYSANATFEGLPWLHVEGEVEVLYCIPVLIAVSRGLDWLRLASCRSLQLHIR